MITTIFIAMLTSHIAEVVTAINKRLQGTILAGSAAFVLSLLMAFIGGMVKVFYIDGVPLPSLGDYASYKAVYPAFTEVWTISQMYFLLVVQKLNLDVQPHSAEPVVAPAI